MGVNSAVTYLGALGGAALLGPAYESAGLTSPALIASGFVTAAGLASWASLYLLKANPARTGA